MSYRNLLIQGIIVPYAPQSNFFTCIGYGPRLRTTSSQQGTHTVHISQSMHCSNPFQRPTNTLNFLTIFCSSVLGHTTFHSQWLAHAGKETNVFIAFSHNNEDTGSSMEPEHSMYRRDIICWLFWMSDQNVDSSLF